MFLFSAPLPPYEQEAGLAERPKLLGAAVALSVLGVPTPTGHSGALLAAKAGLFSRQLRHAGNARGPWRVS